MKYTILFPLLFVFQNVAIKGADNISLSALAGTYKFDISTRRPLMPEVYPKLPNYNTDLTKQAAGPDSVPVSRHHIIPVNRLIQFYNKLVQKSEASKLSTFLVELENKISKFYNRNATEAREFILGLLKNTIVYNSNAMSPDQFDDFQQYYTWLPGNLFIGPTSDKRSDDPGDEFEKDAKVIVGDRFENLKNVNTLMRNYISNITVSFTELSDELRDIVNIMQPIQLRSSDWERNADGKYKIKTGGNQNRKFGVGDFMKRYDVV